MADEWQEGQWQRVDPADQSWQDSSSPYADAHSLSSTMRGAANLIQWIGIGICGGHLLLALAVFMTAGDFNGFAAMVSAFVLGGMGVGEALAAYAVALIIRGIAAGLDAVADTAENTRELANAMRKQRQSA